MPLFRRALWPQDHRDELIAGALVGAVVVVLGYASGIGAPSASSAPSAAPPAATEPSSPSAPAPPAAPGGTAEGAPGGGAAGTGMLPIAGGPGVFYPGSAGEDHTAHPGGSGHTGHGASPAPSGPPPSPAPSGPTTTQPPTAGDDTCEDGEVRLVRPLLTGLTEPVLGLLDPTATASPTPRPSPCAGLAPLSSLLGGTTTPTPVPSLEATP
ncbi:hypothetical protein ACIBU0_40215 [Streptomyces sp. NPDC049627]|uniref:hypothetical protein n=1 Tax=Streptomyces sp. NPDC049627 TaxID=3365595 RepID=UPI0037AE055B